MSCHEIEILLDDYVDDELDTPRRQTVERHLTGCASCAAIVTELRSLVAAAAALPREVAPRRDLFPGIAERIEGGTVTAIRRRRVPWMGIAAASLVLAVAGGLALMLRGGPDTGPAPVATSQAAAIPASASDAEPLDAAVREYQQAADELLASIEARRESFSPETLAVLEKNLAVIDKAIAEVQATLAAGPHGRESALVLTAMHEQKVELLRRVSRLSSLVAL